MLVNQISGYHTSTDYELLAELSKNHSVICIVDYDKELNIRDVASTNYLYKNGEGIWMISARGFNYITAFNKEEFINYCRFNHVTFLLPNI